MRSRPSLPRTSRSAAGHLLEVVARAVAARQVDGVEHGQQLHDQRLAGPLEVLGLLADHALLVVLELGLHAAEGVEVLVALAGAAADDRVLLGQRAGRPARRSGPAGAVLGAGRGACDRACPRSGVSGLTRTASPLVDDLGVDDVVVGGRPCRRRRRAAGRRPTALACS